MPDQWRVVLGPGPLAQVRPLLDEWRESIGKAYADDDIRVDLIRAIGGDQLRVLVREGTETDEPEQ